MELVRKCETLLSRLAECVILQQKEQVWEENEALLVELVGRKMAQMFSICAPQQTRR